MEAGADAADDGTRAAASDSRAAARSDRPALSVEWLGRVPYGEALAIQEDAVRARVTGRTVDRLLLLEHPPVITFGRSAKPGHLLLGEASLRARGVELFEVARGGDVTYHAPGQLVGYPIVDLSPPHRRDVHAFLRALEAGLIDALEGWGIPACRVEGRTGVFIDRTRSRLSRGPQRKIASIGIGLRRWVTWHGFALNVDLDLAGFDAIVPCGLADVVMTSVERELAIERRAGHAPARPGASPGPGDESDPDGDRGMGGGSGGDAALGERMRASVGRSLARRLAR